jgi:LssY C-terminus
VSPLYLFNRYQDIALQKARSSISQRNHLRLWQAPFTLEGKTVWIGQISRDIGIKLTTKSWSLTTHRVSAYVDQERDYLLQDLLLTGFVDRFGYVTGVGESSPDHARTNLTDDPYYTDGLRLVVFLGSEPHTPAQIQPLDWERPVFAK